MALDDHGLLSGTPVVAGAWEFMIRVQDDGGAEDSAVSILHVRFPPVRVNMHFGGTLPPAHVGEPYEAQLSVDWAASDELSWTLLGESELPAGLALLPSGRIEGTPAAGQLEQAPSREFLFALQVTDGTRTETGTNAIDLRIQRIPEPVEPDVFETDVVEPPAGRGSGGGCQAGGSDASLAALVLVLGLGLAYRRRAAT